MKSERGNEPQFFRLWIVTCLDERPKFWNESPGQAKALELVEDALYSHQEAADFLEGFNSLILENDDSIWAVAVPVTLRYEGDTQPGMAVRGFPFPRESPGVQGFEEPASAGQTVGLTEGGLTTGAPPPDPARGLHFQGLDQSPQRSR